MASLSSHDGETQRIEGDTCRPGAGQSNVDPETLAETPRPLSVSVCATGVPAIVPADETDDEFDLANELQGDDGTASLTSSICAAFAYERGRRYQLFGDGEYPIPNDDLEQNREDMKHAMLMMLTESKPFLAPIGSHPQKILDIGTGTGKRWHSPILSMHSLL